MEKLKKLILKIAADKGIFFIKAFLTAIVTSFACITAIFIFYSNDVQPVTISNIEAYEYLFFANLSLAIIWITFFVLMTAVYLIIAFYVTAFSIRKNRTILLHKGKNSSEIYCTPLWGKRTYSIINFPDNWSRVMREGGVKYFNFPFELSIDKQVLNGRGTETIIAFPIVAKFFFNGPLNKADLEKIVRNKKGDALEEKSIDIDDYLLDRFIELNSSKKITDKIKDAAISWDKGKISQVHLSRIAVQDIGFPKNIFSNIEKTEIKAALAETRIGIITE